MPKLNDNGKGSLKANLPKAFTDQLGWNKTTNVKVELKGKKLILSEVKHDSR